MGKLVLQVQARDKVGKSHAKRLRKKGFIPGVLYGPHLERSMPLKIEASNLNRFLSSLSEEDRIITLQFTEKNNEDKKEVIIKEAHYNWLKGELEHVDFYEITRGELISTKVPLRLVGDAPGAKKGGVIEQMIREVEVECFPENIPPHIELDLKDLEIGDSARIKDLQVPSEVEILTNPEEIVVSIVSPITEEELERLEEEKGVVAEEVELVEKERKEKKEEIEEEEKQPPKKEK
ncbi:50S ribosomal protein L25/general stress protein Ctc [Candidatus Aerophobetes bacterium]|nr:50S ribosomal protein L25/general stress protein Ctc [Candidatus Aerophobetes bacterium]